MKTWARCWLMMSAVGPSASGCMDFGSAQDRFCQRNVMICDATDFPLRETRMSDAAGFTEPAYYSTLQFPDVNGDGRADVCARAASGIVCELSDGESFGTLLTQTSFSDASGWGKPEYYSTIAFPDVNGDGKADVCGRGAGGVVCALSSGTSLGVANLWAWTFNDGHGWNLPPYYTTLQFADVNHDGRADLCGRSIDGIVCALSTGTLFGTPALWAWFASDANGWADGPQYYGTIRFPDINSDGFADVCGRDRAGVICALSTGTSFAKPTLWMSGHGDANGWNAGPQYYETLRYADINADGRVDLCARGDGGVLCSLSNGASFGEPTLWTTWYRDAEGGNRAEYYQTITLTDLNRDGQADFCGRTVEGVACFSSNGSAFEAPTFLTKGPSDVAGWAEAPYYSTIRLADIDADGVPEVCGRGKAGVSCSN